MNGQTSPTRPIATLTLNPAIDVSYEIPRLVPDQKSHATATRTDPGGNGINVGRALRVMGVPAANFCIMAGNAGTLLETLLVDQIDHVDCERVEGETRINATVLEAASESQYEVTGIGPFVPAVVLSKVLGRFLDRVEGGFGILSGSVPPGVPSDIYGEMVRRVRECGGLAVVDAHGALLRESLALRPFLIKPNRYELSLLLGKEVPRIEDVAEEARLLVRQGIGYVCVSLGAEGALLAGPEGTFHAKAPPIVVKCTVGAGDSMVAGLIAAFSRGESAAEALRLAVACGSGTAAQPGTAIFTAGQLQELLARTEVSALDI